MARVSKKEAISEIEDFFKEIGTKTPAEIKKIRSSAQGSNIPLQEKKKKFCKKCLSVFNSQNSEIRIKKGLKRVFCKKCGNASRWKINSS